MNKKKVTVHTHKRPQHPLFFGVEFKKRRRLTDKKDEEVGDAEVHQTQVSGGLHVVNTRDYQDDQRVADDTRDKNQDIGYGNPHQHVSRRHEDGPSNVGVGVKLI